jgi:hypothetical protein
MPLIARYTIKGMHVDTMCKTACIHEGTGGSGGTLVNTPWRLRAVFFTAGN